MAYSIFEVKSDLAVKINEITKDDLVSRQSILTRDAQALDIDKDVVYLRIEGSEQGLKRAEELAKEFSFKKLDAKEASAVDKKIQEQEDSAASGMGMIFD